MNPSAPSTQMFSVNIDGETVNDEWNKAVPIPAALAKRNAALEKRHHSTSPTEMENKMTKAQNNYKENLENTRSKAAKETTKVHAAQERRAEFGENMSMMGNAMGNNDTTTKLPKVLSERLATLAPSSKTTTASLVTKQQKAAANRKAANEAKQAKANKSSARIAAAKDRKHAQVRADAPAGIFQVDASEGNNAASGGWNENIKLPARLAKRVEEVNAHFDYDVMKRYANTEAKYISKQDAIVAKAKIASERVEAAKVRRALRKGDDFHFTVTSTEESMDKAQGWAPKPQMPARLQARLDTLKGKFTSASPNTRQERAAIKRATFHKSIAAKGRAETEKCEAATRTRALASGSATHFTVSEAKFAGDVDETMANKHGWGTQQTSKLPSRLQERLASMNFGPKTSQSQRQAAAATKRSEFQRSIAMKASAESDRVAAVQQQKKLQKGDVNTFTVTFDADSENVDSKQGWMMKPPMPNALKDRLAAVTFSSTMDMSTKQANAEVRRVAFQSQKSATAAYETEKSANALSRRLVSKGDEKTLFSISASDASTDSSNGWGVKKSMPSHLQARLNTLTTQHKSKPHAERQAAASKKRNAFLKSVSTKASMETDKMNNAISRKKLEAGDANTFSVTFAGDEANPAAQGWNQTQRLPSRLQERLKSLGETFKMKPYAAREEKASLKRAQFLEGLASKASEESDKIANAQSRRECAMGDASHFTVATTDDEDAVVQQQGWGYKPSMPQRLQNRLKEVTFKSTTTMKTKQANAEARRIAHQATIAAKAAAETDKCLNAKSRKAMIQGSETLFTMNVSEEKDLSKGNGWGVPTSLPARLEARYKSLNAKHHHQRGSPATRQQAAAMNRKAVNVAKQAKAHTSTERGVAAQSRKSLAEGNEECFRVEFDGEEAAKKSKGWGPGSPALPKRLARRAADMIKISPTKNPFEAMNKATENRDEYLSTLVAKAHQTSLKMEAARARKLRNELDSGIILINTKNQRKLSPVKLPTRLSERVKQLTQRFGYDGAEREVRVEENRQRRLNEIRLKAGNAIRHEQAKERRQVMKRRSQIERMSNPLEATRAATNVGQERMVNDMDDMEEGACSKTRKSCTIC